jgi:hypothetical protein
MLEFEKFIQELLEAEEINYFLLDKDEDGKTIYPINQSDISRTNYLKNIWSNLRNLQWEITRLNDVEIYFSIDKIPVNHSNEIYYLDYYRYHYEYFRIKSISILDYLILFINHCLQMGIVERKCNIYSITENTILKESSLVQNLKKFDQEILPLRKERNYIIHKGTFEPKFMESLNDIVIDIEMNFVDKNETEKTELKKKEIKKAIEHFKNEIKMINRNVEKILNDLIPYIRKQNKFFKLSD